MALRILLVEDNAADAVLIRELLERSNGAHFEIDHVARLSYGLTQLLNKEFDLVLLDLSLPDSLGFNTFAAVQARAAHVPTIVLTGLNDKAIALKTMRHGAQDYIIKGEINSDLLQRSIHYAIERKRAEEALRQRKEELEALHQVALEITGELDLDRLLTSIAARAVELTGCTSGTLGLYLPDQDMVELSVYVGMETPPTQRCFRRGEGATGRVLETRQPLLINDYAGWSGKVADWERHIGHAALLGVPICWNREFLGCLEVFAPSSHALNQTHVTLLESFATQAAIAIRNARLFEEEHRRRQEAETLRESALALSSAGEQDSIVKRILVQLQAVVPYDTASVQLLNDDHLRIVGSHGFSNPEDLLSYMFPLTADNPNCEVMRTSRPFILADAQRVYEAFKQEPHASANIHSWLGVPMLIGERPIGMIALDKQDPGYYEPRHAALAEAFAAHAAVAIENARLQRELQEYAQALEELVALRTEELQSEHAQLKAILQSIGDGIVVLDAQGHILRTNPVAQSWFDQLLSPKDADRLRSAIAPLVQQAAGNPEEILELKGTDLELQAALISGPDAREGNVVVAIHDITHLRALDRMKSRFISNITHELRTPLTTIKLYTQLLKQPTSRQADYIAAIEKEVNHEIRLVEQVLDISRLDAGRLEISPEPASLNDLLHDVIEDHKLLAANRSLEMAYEPCRTTPNIMLDKQYAILVFNNLLRNAIQYTPAGGHIHVAIRCQETAGRNWATVTVADTGMGIPQEELPLVFERFYRGKKARAMQISGNGLGLAIVKEITELHGGQITVESKVDQGSAFTVWFPLAEGAKVRSIRTI
ncbi:MAG: GAF domain-containing protein [Anaerolineae bacterium]|nr:GAF domain-containing protein [Anaerolineae bacterium]